MSKIGILNQVLLRFYLICIHELKQWGTHTKTRKTVLVSACARSWSSLVWLSKKFFSSLNRPPSLPFSGSWWQDVVLRLRMSGAIPLLPLCPYVSPWHGQGELYFLLYSICPQTINTQGTVLNFVWPQCCRFFPVGTLKEPSDIHFQWKMTRHFTNTFFMPFGPFSTTLGPLQGCDRPYHMCLGVQWFGGRLLWAFVVNCDETNDKNSKFVELKCVL
jgi:hypothetical protein